MSMFYNMEQQPSIQLILSILEGNRWDLHAVQNTGKKSVNIVTPTISDK